MDRIKKIVSIIRTNLYRILYKIHVGKHTVFLGPADLISNKNTYIGNNCVIYPWTVFREWGGYIKIGNNCSINSFCHISGNGGVEIGNNVRIATQCVFISANHNFSRCDIPIVHQGETKEKIVINDDCWFGAGVKVLAGVTIGRGCVIGAGAVVTHDLDPYSVAVGIPAVVIKKRNAEGFEK